MRSANTFVGPLDDRGLQAGQDRGRQRLGPRVEARSDAGAGELGEDGVVTSRRRVVGERRAESVEEGQPGRQRRRGVPGDDAVRARRRVAQPDPLVGGERQQLEAVLDVVGGADLRGAVHERAADEPDVLIGRADAAQTGRHMAVEARSGNEEVARPVAGRPRPHVMEHVRVRIEELEHVVLVVGHGGHVEHERALAQVDVGHAVERVVVGRDEHLMGGVSEIALVAELVERRVGEIVGHRDARLGLLLTQEVEQRDAVDVGVGADLLRLSLGKRGRGRRGGRDGRQGEDADQPDRAGEQSTGEACHGVLSEERDGEDPSHYLQFVKLTLCR